MPVADRNIRVVITGVGLTAPNANNIKELRNALLTQKSGITQMEVRYMGQVAVGNCHFDENPPHHFIFIGKTHKNRTAIGFNVAPKFKPVFFGVIMNIFVGVNLGFPFIL